MSGFPFLQLPHLPLLEIVKQTDHREIAILSLTSEKAEMLIRAAKREISFAYFTIDALQMMNVLEILKIISYEKERRSSYFEIRPIISSVIGLQVSFELFSKTADSSIYVKSIDNMKNYQETRRTMKIKGQEVPFIMKSGGKSIMTFWKDTMEGWMSIGEHLKDSLGLEVSGICVKGSPEHESLGCAQKKVPINEIIEWTRQNMKIHSRSSIKEDQHFSDEDYSKILSFVKSAANLTIDFKRPVQMDTVPFNTQKLTNNASWINFRYILECESEKVHLKHIEVREIKKIIEHWAGGGKLNCRKILIEPQEAVKAKFLLDGCHCSYQIVIGRYRIQRRSGNEYADLFVRNEQTFELHICTIPECNRTRYA